MSIQLITIGSCLSFLIACHYNRLKQIKCLSSTRHNRVDKIVNTYLEKTQKEIPESLIELLKFDRDNPDLKQIIDNQFSSRMLGKTALDSESAISLTEIADGNHHIDLIIYDSYCELLLKLLTVKNGEGTFFLNTGSCENWQDFFEIEKERLEISKVVDYYCQFVKYFKTKNPETKFIFINYPFLDHHNQLIRLRTQQLNDLLIEHQYLKENTYFVPAIHIPSEYWMNVAHFKYHNNRNFHDDYALVIKIIMEGHFTPLEWHDFVKNKGDHLLDDMILMFPDFPGYRPPIYSMNFDPKTNPVTNLPYIYNPNTNDNKQHKKLDIQKLQYYLNQGNLLKKNGELEQAFEQYQKAIELEPNFVPALNQLAEISEQHKSPETAILYLKRIAQLQPDHPSQIKLAQLMRQQGQTQEAIVTYQKIIALKLNQVAKIYSYLADTLEHNDQILEAVAVYEKAIKIEPNLPFDIYWKLGNLYQTQEKLEDSVAAYRRAIELKPDHPNLYFDLGRVLSKQKNFPEAIDCYTKALQHNQNHYLAYIEFKNVTEELGKINQGSINYDNKFYKNSDQMKLKIDDLKSYKNNQDSLWNSTHDVQSLTLETTSSKILLSIPKTHPTEEFCPFHKFKDEEGAFIFKIKNGQAWGDKQYRAVRTAYSPIIREASLFHSTSTFDYLDELYSNVYSKQKFDGTVAILIQKCAPQNYYHWMLQVILQLLLLRASGLDINAIDRFICYPLQQPFQKETLKIIGISLEKIIEFSGINFYIQARELVLTSALTAIPQKWSCDYLRQFFLKNISDEFNEFKRIYISRSRASYRQLMNEEEVISVLTEFGFQVVHLETLSVQEQVTLLSKTEVVVAPHGAGLTNLIFCNPGTKVIEIFSRSYTPVMYQYICHYCNLDHYYLLGDVVENTESDNPRDQHLRVNPKLLRDILNIAEIS